MQNESVSPPQNDEEEYVSDFDYHEAPIPEGARRARIMGNKTSMESYVQDEHFYVQDIVSGGRSRVALSGAPLQYRPIPLTFLQEKNLDVDLL